MPRPWMDIHTQAPVGYQTACSPTPGGTWVPHRPSHTPVMDACCCLHPQPYLQEHQPQSDVAQNLQGMTPQQFRHKREHLVILILIHWLPPQLTATRHVGWISNPQCPLAHMHASKHRKGAALSESSEIQLGECMSISHLPLLSRNQAPWRVPGCPLPRTPLTAAGQRDDPPNCPYPGSVDWIFTAPHVAAPQS
jgi:hypothetical protein